MDLNCFTHNGVTYRWDHLRETTLKYIRAADKKNPEVVYTVDVEYSNHCYTRGIETGEAVDPTLRIALYPEVRVFELRRWELSHYLPDIIAGMLPQQCFHAGGTNYLRIEVLDPVHGGNVEYKVIFSMERKRRGVLKMYIVTAHPNDRGKAMRERHNQPIKFSFILHNTLNGKPIRRPPRR